MNKQQFKELTEKHYIIFDIVLVGLSFLFCYIVFNLETYFGFPTNHLSITQNTFYAGLLSTIGIFGTQYFVNKYPEMLD